MKQQVLKKTKKMMKKLQNIIKGRLQSQNKTLKYIYKTVDIKRQLC